MQRVNPVAIAVFGGAVTAVAVFAWLNRYEYQTVQPAPGSVFETRRDRWTGEICVTYAKIWQLVPPGLYSCEVDLSEFVTNRN
jgi:hypothetical protein